ncbi:MAG: hypothetical protein ABI584_00065 [Acidobacteriota bacterium]
MPDADLIELFVAPLNDAGLTYMVTGSVASMLYAEPRFTADVDVVLRLTAPEDLRKAFSSPGYYCPPADVIAVEMARPLHGHVNVLHTPSALKADVYFASEDPLHRWALPLRRRFDVGGREIWVAPPEYVILRKLLFFREGGSSKHVRDVRALLVAQGEKLDVATLERLASERGVGDLLAEILATPP